MKKLERWIFALLLFPTFAWGQSTPLSEIDSLIKQMLPAGSEVGIAAYDLTDRCPLYTYRAEKLSRPASTMKLLTAITALSQPEATAPFCTEVRCDGTIVSDTLKGNLYVVGGFDPEFDNVAMDSLVAQVTAAPFSVITGRVYGDISLKDSLSWGQGWAWDDAPAAFQPYLSPLMFCKGAVEVTALPSALVGDTALLVCNPPSSYYTIVNRTKSRTPAAGNFVLTRNWMEQGNQLLLTGDVDGTRKATVSIYDSPRYFMRTFLDRLRERGVVVADTIGFAPLPPENDSMRVTRGLARWETPVQAVLEQMLKKSDNLNAEALLCRIAAQATGKRHLTAEDGIVEIMKLVRQLGDDPKDYKMADGCGLSNYNYLSPALLVDFLKYAYSRTDIFQSLYKALPVGGVDGTLKNRMTKAPLRGNVHAKTGSFTAINALAGYLQTKKGHEVAFAIMNQNILSAAQARAFQDRVCKVLIEQ
jgi:D-alanyl-D-alanine carboxypeptidase/D-alanyl-D-alanine-endopeptidase (penicillin-binding protein 4)